MRTLRTPNQQATRSACLPPPAITSAVPETRCCRRLVSGANGELPPSAIPSRFGGIRDGIDQPHDAAFVVQDQIALPNKDAGFVQLNGQALEHHTAE